MNKTKLLPVVVLVMSIGGGVGVVPAWADDQASFKAACVHVSPGQVAMCTCLAEFAMTADPQLRGDMILSMANPAKYRTKAEAGKISSAEMGRWIQFNGASGRKCHVDD